MGEGGLSARSFAEERESLFRGRASIASYNFTIRLTYPDPLKHQTQGPSKA